MDVIRELYSLIKKLIGRKSPILPFVLSKKYLYTKLLNGIIEGKYQTETEAEIDISANNKVGDQSYSKTKQLLIEKLLSLVCILNLDSATYSLYMVNHFSAKRELFVAEVLQWFGLHNALYYIVTRRTLRKAKKYELTDIQYGCFKLLRNYESKRGSIKKCEEYARKVNETLNILLVESRVENIRTRLNASLNKQMSPDEKTLQLFVDQIEWIEGDVSRYPTRTVMINYFISAGLIYRLSGDFEKAYGLYQQYYSYLNDNPAIANGARKAEVCYYLVRCCLMMRDYDKGFHYARLRTECQPVGAVNEFAFMEAYCLLYIHSKQHHKAGDIFRWVKSHKDLYGNDKRVEKWGIIEAYIRLFLSNSDPLALPESVTIYGNIFNVSRLLNEIDETRQDRHGMNIAILVFQVLYLLKERKFKALDERINYIKNYVQNTIRPDSTKLYYRTDCLFKMFALAQENQYAYDKTKHTTAVLLQKMKAFQAPDVSDCHHVEEVIPHEQSWQLFIRALERETIVLEPAHKVG